MYCTMLCVLYCGGKKDIMLYNCMIKHEHPVERMRMCVIGKHNYVDVNGT
jgi:predicted molibdopterin-dependent oxidoreductase YjgC